MSHTLTHTHIRWTDSYLIARVRSDTGVPGCDQNWLPEALDEFVKYNRKLIDKGIKKGQPKFPEWALQEIDYWKPDQPTKALKTNFTADRICCPYKNAVETNPDCPPDCCNVPAAEAILEDLMQDDVNTILVSWEHFNADFLIRTWTRVIHTHP